MKNWIITYFLFFVSGLLSAAETIVILSSDLGPFQQALQGFNEEFSQSSRVFNLKQEAPELKGDEIIVAFGGKAALYEYPDGVDLIYGMIPSSSVQPRVNSGSMVRVEMSPPADFLIAQTKIMNPQAEAIAVFNVQDAYSGFCENLERAAEKGGMKARVLSVKNDDELGRAMEEIAGKVQALWLVPDAMLLNLRTFDSLRGFCQANKIMLLVPTHILVSRGAAASISPDFSESGRSAARALKTCCKRKLRLMLSILKKTRLLSVKVYLKPAA